MRAFLFLLLLRSVPLGRPGLWPPLCGTGRGAKPAHGAEAPLFSPNKSFVSQRRATLDAFTLHSRPSARKVLYLDFNGHNISDSEWNKGRNATLEASTVNLNTTQPNYIFIS